MANQLKIVRETFIQLMKPKIEDYYDFHSSINDKIGKGLDGTVYRARLKNRKNIWRAIKQIPKNNGHDYMNQINILKTLDHPNIVKLYEVYQNNDFIYLVTELCEGGQIYYKLEKEGIYNQNEARYIFTQMIEVVAYCHQKKIAHRDLKLQNFLFVNNDSLEIKLIDFGCSFQYKNDMKEQLKLLNNKKLIGSCFYISPQVIKFDYNQKADIWSLGVILYILVSAIPPFCGGNDQQIIQSIKSGQYSCQIPQIQKKSDSLKDLIKKILVPQQNRLSIVQISQHSWVRKRYKIFPVEFDFIRMTKFCDLTQLQILYITCLSAQSEDKNMLLFGKLFRLVDYNNDGQITIQQFKRYQQNSEEQINLASFQLILSYLQKRKGGSFSYTQFVAFNLSTEIIFDPQNLQYIFQKFSNRTKSISQQTLFKFSKNHIGQKGLQLQFIQQVIYNTQKKEDKQINYEEFAKNIKKINL